MAAGAEAVGLQLAHSDAHLLKVNLAIEAALVADGIDLGDHVAQLGMTLQNLHDLTNLIVEAGALRGIARRVVKPRFFPEARREHELERRHLRLERAEALVQTEEYVFGRESFDSRDLLGRVGG